MVEEGGACVGRGLGGGGRTDLRPLREAPVTLEHAHRDAALLQRQRQRRAADATAHDGHGGRRRAGVQRRCRWPRLQPDARTRGAGHAAEHRARDGTLRSGGGGAVLVQLPTRRLGGRDAGAEALAAGDHRARLGRPHGRPPRALVAMFDVAGF